MLIIKGTKSRERAYLNDQKLRALRLHVCVHVHMSRYVVYIMVTVKDSQNMLKLVVPEATY